MELISVYKYHVVLGQDMNNTEPVLSISARQVAEAAGISFAVVETAVTRGQLDLTNLREMALYIAECIPKAKGKEEYAQTVTIAAKVMARLATEWERDQGEGCVNWNYLSGYLGVPIDQVRQMGLESNIEQDDKD